MTALARGGRLSACDICKAPLSGNQKRFCSSECKAQSPARVQKPRNCIDCGVPISRRAQRCYSCRARARVGELSGTWIGDAVSVKGGHSRAQSLYALDKCEWLGCDAPAVDRHHVDGNTANNAPSNIQGLCRRHHMATDQRKTRFSALTDRQREVLAEAARREWVSPRMFVSATTSMDSSRSRLRGLAERGLLKRHEINPALFLITDAGREAVS